MTAGRSIPPRSSDSRDVDALVRVLTLECDSLERLRYRASVAVLLLRAGETRFLPRVADEIIDVVDAIGQLELLRATVVASLAADGDNGTAPTLTALIAGAQPAHAVRLRDLQDRLRSVLTELQELTGAGTVVAATELGSIRRSLGRWSGVGAEATAYGRPVTAPTAARFDQTV